MYDKRFGLTRRPFPASPDSDRYYPATSHESTLATLLAALADDEGIVLVTGAPGTGKTLLAQVLLDRLPDGTCSGLLTNSHFADRSALVQAILYDLDLPYADRGEQVLRLRLTEHLLKTCAAGQRTLLVVDEAQHLGADLLEELRLLTNLEGGGRKALQVVLIAQPAMLDTLAQPALDVLHQRLAVRCQVEPLGADEGADYLHHHLRQAGGEPQTIFDESAIELLVRATGGVPRRLNQAAHQALVLADAADLNCVDVEATLEVLQRLGLSAADAETDRPSVAGSFASFEIGERRSA